MTPLYIFDLDGTLALIDHRRHLVEGEKKDWPAFYRACVDDMPNEAVISVLTRLLSSGAEVWIWSGRSDEVRDQTTVWLMRNVRLSLSEIDCGLEMRPADDYTPDDVLKRQWLDAMSETDRERLVAVFDDRDKVVAMWRAAGVPCFQVAPGAF